MKVSCRSSIAPSIQLLNGAALLANSRYSWSMVSSNFSVLWWAWKTPGYRTIREALKKGPSKSCRVEFLFRRDLPESRGLNGWIFSSHTAFSQVKKPKSPNLKRIFKHGGKSWKSNLPSQCGGHTLSSVSWSYFCSNRHPEGEKGLENGDNKVLLDVIWDSFWTGLTCKASLRFWVRAPSASHWSQMRWQRAFTLGES